jgi:hypothetical protein
MHIFPLFFVGGILKYERGQVCIDQALFKIGHEGIL